jgi:hypothetical protein
VTINLSFDEVRAAVRLYIETKLGHPWQDGDKVEIGHDGEVTVEIRTGDEAE